MISITKKTHWRQETIAALLLACTACASGDSATAKPPDTLGELMDVHRCETIVRLEQVRSSKEAAGQPKKKDRYIVLSSARNQNHFVQCIFIDDDARMLCEASSGFYVRNRPETPKPFLGTPARDALVSLGFSSDDSDGNFQHFVDMKPGNSLETVADLVLTALHNGYGVRRLTKLTFMAPLGPGGDAVKHRCVPVG
jgi:hypothetical protein